MKYDFSTVLDRRGKDSLAADVIPFENVSVEEGFDSIPMWIADMSFPVAPCITEAIKKLYRERIAPKSKNSLAAEEGAHYNAPQEQ